MEPGGTRIGTSSRNRRAVAEVAWKRRLTGRLLRLLEENALLVVLVGALGAALLLLGPALLVSDSWLGFVAGREITRHGLPTHDHMALLTHSRRWTDQQWLAQLLLYREWLLGGLRLAVIVNVGLVALTFASAIAFARLRGASARSVLYVAVPCLLAAPWSWQVRPQTFALPLFVVAVYLLTQDVRRPSPTTLVVFPMLVVWANLHGSVVLGATLIALAGVASIVRERHIDVRASVFVLLPWACLLASPYALRLPAYYKLMLVDAPFSRYVVEWQHSRPSALTAMFYVVALATLIVATRRRRLFNFYEMSILVLLLVEAVLAVRGIVWFVLAALVLVPSGLDGLIAPKGDRARKRRFDRLLASLAIVAVLATLVVVAQRPQRWFERNWPLQAAATVAKQPQTANVFASDRLADWLLWRVPSLRGRIAFDVRFELLDRGQFDPLIDFADQKGSSWARATYGYVIVVLDLRQHAARLKHFRSQPDTAVLYESAGEVAVIRQPSRDALTGARAADASAAFVDLSGGSKPAAR